MVAAASALLAVGPLHEPLDKRNILLLDPITNILTNFQVYYWLSDFLLLHMLDSHS